MKKPLIAVTVSTGKRNGQDNSYNPIAYSQAVNRAGGLPFLIPNDFSLNDVSTICQTMDGILFSGGGDVDIKYFNGKSHPAIGEPDPARDALELALAKEAFNRQIPIFGICRGVQVINVALGGTLITDIPDQYPTQIQHSTTSDKGRDYHAHDVKIEPGTLLAKIIKKSTIPVNSFHHQAILKPAPELKVTAYATDGLIEAVEISDASFRLVGVQWHPECIQDYPEQQNLFKSFVEACGG